MAVRPTSIIINQYRVGEGVGSFVSSDPCMRLQRKLCRLNKRAREDHSDLKCGRQDQSELKICSLLLGGEGEGWRREIALMALIGGRMSMGRREKHFTKLRTSRV